MMNTTDVLAWCIVVPSFVFIFWFVDKYGERINLFVDNQARRMECPLVDKVYVWVCFLSALFGLSMFAYSIWWTIHNYNDCNLIFVGFWFYVWWVGTDIIRMYSKYGRCKHLDWQVIIGQEEDGVISNAFNYKHGVMQEVSAWCPDCGALKIDGEWTDSRNTKKKRFKDIRVSTEGE